MPTGHLTRRRFAATVGGGTILGMAGCLSDDADSDNEGSGELGDPADAVDVAIMTHPRPNVDPRLVHLEPGGTVTWVGEGDRNAVAAYHPDTHTHQRIPDGAEPWRSGIIREGGSYEHTFEIEGVYDYADPTAFCSTHEAIGVVGRVVVGWPELESEPALQHDPQELPSRAATVMKEINEECHSVLTEH